VGVLKYREGVKVLCCAIEEGIALQWHDDVGIKQ